MDPVEPREVGVTAAEDAPARQALLERFADRLVIRPELTRQQVSYQGNKAHPGLRWLRYKEAFSAEFVHSELGSADGPVLDPFAGIGTTALVASGRRSRWPPTRSRQAHWRRPELRYSKQSAAREFRQDSGSPMSPSRNARSRTRPKLSWRMHGRSCARRRKSPRRWQRRWRRSRPPWLGTGISR